MSEDKTYTVDEVIKMGTEIGVQTGMEYIRKEKENRRLNRLDRRLRNTKMLLREYKKLCIHSRDAVDKNQCKEIVIDILDELDSFEYSDDLYIESIKRSKERTAIIVEHIKKMMQIYKYMSTKSRKPEELRRYNIILKMYMKSPEATVEELSAEYHIDTRSIYRDIEKAVETLASLIFGIDGLKVY
jgi:hypothetical protein